MSSSARKAVVDIRNLPNRSGEAPGFFKTWMVFFGAREQALSSSRIFSMVSRTPYCCWKSRRPSPPYAKPSATIF